MKSRFALSTFAFLAAIAPACAAEKGAAPPQRPVLIELYTSQGCSDCPPADEILADIAGRPGIIALSFPITYWDMLGWRDTLATEANTRRQRAYAHEMGRKGTYTPQLVIGGIEDVVGNHRGNVLDGIARHARLNAEEDSIALSAMHSGSALTVALDGALPDGAGGNAAATVWVMRVLSTAQVAVRGGENNERNLVYTNVVRDMRRAGAWNGGAQTFTIPIALQSGQHDGIAVVVQRGEYGRVLAAALIEPEIP